MAGVSPSTLYRRFRKLEESGAVEGMMGATPPGKIESQVVKKVSADITSDALKIYEQIYEVGKYVYRNYSTTAYNKGISVYEFIDLSLIHI